MESKAGLAAYQRVVEAIKADITSGRLAPHARLAGNRTLADEHGVALATLQKALKILQDEGWLVSTPAVGVFVSDQRPAESDAPVSLETISQQLDALQKTLESLNDRVTNLEEGQGLPYPAAPES
jgi:DNA-binding GntR family transcriptional regulator